MKNLFYWEGWRLPFYLTSYICTSNYVFLLSLKELLFIWLWNFFFVAITASWNLDGSDQPVKRKFDIWSIMTILLISTTWSRRRWSQSHWWWRSHWEAPGCLRPCSTGRWTSPSCLSRCRRRLPCQSRSAQAAGLRVFALCLLLVSVSSHCNNNII